MAELGAIGAANAASKMAGDGFAMEMFGDFGSPKRDPYGKLKGVNPFLVEIRGSGAYSIISGSSTDRRGNLKPLYGGSAEVTHRMYDTPRYYNKIATCFVDNKLAADGNYMVPAGFNYGYSHAMPTPPAYHFNRRHYGHFRDMMETPGETALVVGTAGKQSPPVKTRFFSRGGASDVDPVTTNSQNLSTFCTSSIPYDEGDGQLRDRRTIQPDLVDTIEFSESMELNVGE